jgi:DNA topoisomerase-1
LFCRLAFSNTVNFYFRIARNTQLLQVVLIGGKTEVAMAVKFNKNLINTIITSPEDCIDCFDLTYVYDRHFTIKRQKKEDTFYYTKNNKELTKKKDLARIEALVIPPTWKNVKISALDNGHLQAFGRDEKGRKQYRYHQKWNAIRNSTKFLKMIRFGELLPAIREKVAIDLQQQRWTQSKVLALIIRLLEETHIRIGNEQYARRNKTYGLTTLRNKHVDLVKNNLKIEFIGKRGKQHKITLKNKKLVKLIHQCQEIPGWELFQYYDDNNVKKSIDSSMVNEYIHNLTGEIFTAKDFRTWAASSICFATLYDLGVTKNANKVKKNVITAIDFTAKSLGNTRTVSKKYYIHPEIISTYKNGDINQFFNTIKETTSTNKNELTPVEDAMHGLIKTYTPLI